MKAAVATLEPECRNVVRPGRFSERWFWRLSKVTFHEIGKTLVGTMLSASGFQVYDLGVDVPSAKIIAKVQEVDADLVGLSALLTTTMVKQKEVIDEMDKLGLRKKVKVMVVVLRLRAIGSRKLKLMVIQKMLSGSRTSQEVVGHSVIGIGGLYA